MFVSFFPRPKLFFLSAILWTALAMAFWYGFAANLIVSSAARRRRGDVLVGTVALVRPLFCALRRHLCGRLDGVRAASLGAVVDPRFRTDPVHLLLPGPGQRRHQQLVRAVLRSGPGRAFEIEAGHGRAVLPRIVDLRRHRAGRGRGRRDDAVLRQPLHLPLADGDERLLHRKLATAAHHRGRLAAGAGRHHAVCDHHGRSRRQSDQCRADAACLPAGSGEALQQCHRAAADRLDPLSAGVRRRDLVGARNRRAGADRHPAARNRVLQPAGRSGLSQGTRARRRRSRPAPIHRP